MGRVANEPRWHKGQPANECLGLRRLWGLEFQHTARAIAPPCRRTGQRFQSNQIPKSRNCTLARRPHSSPLQNPDSIN